MLAFLGFVAMTSVSAASPGAKPNAQGGGRARFWKMIDDARAGAGSDQVFMGRLAGRLRSLKPQEISEFNRQFYEVHRGSYRWDLWGACYLMMGGCSDDGFEYFRAWLIGQGQRVFENAERDPDSLASLPGGGELEELMSLAYDIHQEKTGKRIPYPPPGATAVPTDPQGVKWDFENDTENKKRLPKVFARFGR